MILYSDTIRREPSPDFHGHLKEDVDSASRTWFKLMEEKGIPSVQIEVGKRGLVNLNLCLCDTTVVSDSS